MFVILLLSTRENAPASFQERSGTLNAGRSSTWIDDPLGSLLTFHIEESSIQESLALRKVLEWFDTNLSKQYGFPGPPIFHSVWAGLFD